MRLRSNALLGTSAVALASPPSAKSRAACSCRVLVASLCGLMTLLGAGCDSSASGEAGASTAGAILEHPELAPTDERFVIAPPPCEPGTAAGTPILPLPWGRRIETFFPLGVPATALALDYDVAPLARVDHLRVAYAFDQRTQPAKLERDVRCPSVLGPEAFVPSGIAEEVVRARIDLVDSDGEGRSADVFVALGTATLELSLEGVDLGSEDTEARWFALVEPAWGEPRVALAPIPTPAPSTFTLTGVPEGLGRVALVQTAAVVAQDDTVVLHAPEGFAGDFAAYATGWHQGMVSSDTDGPLELKTIVPANASPRFGGLEAGLTWEPGPEPFVVSVPSGVSSGTLAVPCGTVVRVLVTGYANVDVVVDGDDPITLGPGDSSEPPTACAPGAESVLWQLDSESLNGRGFDLVFREVGL